MLLFLMLNFFYGFLHWLLMLLLSIIMVSTHFSPTESVHSSSMAVQLLLMVQEVRNPPDGIISDRAVFDNFISFDDLFAKALQRLGTCLSANNKLCGIIFDDADFNSSNWICGNLTFTLWYSVILYNFIFITNEIQRTPLKCFDSSL